MHQFTRYAVIAALMLSSLAVATDASADTSIYDWPDSQTPVLVKNDSGLLFITDAKQPQRVYSWDQHNGSKGSKSVYLVDLDKDGSPEVVGAGTPTFVLETNADPMWQLEEGCHQTVLADFVADDKLDILCNEQTSMKMYTYDGQLVWKLSLGKKVDQCRAGDYDGDLKADLECKYAGQKTWARVGSDGKVMAKSIDAPEIDADGVDLDEVAPKKTPASLTINDANIDGKIEAQIFKNIDGDGSIDVIVATKTSLYVMDKTGKSQAKYAAAADSYTRTPLAKLNSVYANNFADNDKAQSVVNDLQNDLSKCYAKRVKQNAFTGTGQLILRVSVDKKGKVGEVDQIHSAINDDTVETCAKDVLKNGAFPSAKRAPATVNVNMKYTYRDK